MHTLASRPYRFFTVIRDSTIEELELLTDFVAEACIKFPGFSVKEVKNIMACQHAEFSHVIPDLGSLTEIVEMGVSRYLDAKVLEFTVEEEHRKAKAVVIPIFPGDECVRPHGVRNLAERSRRSLWKRVDLA